MKTIFLRVIEAEDKAAALLAAVREPERARGRQRFNVDPASFASVPRSPFAYWVSDRLRGLFKELSPFEAEGRFALGGRCPWGAGRHGHRLQKEERSHASTRTSISA